MYEEHLRTPVCCRDTWWAVCVWEYVWRAPLHTLSLTHNTLSPSLSHTQQHTHPLSLTGAGRVARAPLHIHSLPHTTQHTHTHSHGQQTTRALSPTHNTTHTHSLAHAQQTAHALSLSLTPNATHTHTRTHAHTQPINMSRRTHEYVTSRYLIGNGLEVHLILIDAAQESRHTHTHMEWVTAHETAWRCMSHCGTWVAPHTSHVTQTNQPRPITSSSTAWKFTMAHPTHERGTRVTSLSLSLSLSHTHTHTHTHTRAREWDTEVMPHIRVTSHKYISHVTLPDRKRPGGVPPGPRPWRPVRTWLKTQSLQKMTHLEALAECLLSLRIQIFICVYIFVYKDIICECIHVYIFWVYFVDEATAELCPTMKSMVPAVIFWTIIYRLCTYAYIHIYIYREICIHINIYIYMYMCRYISTCIYMYMRVYRYISICIYM